MKSTVAGIGSLVPAGAAVMGSVALSLLVLHPPPAGLLPGTAPADRGRVGALVLPAPHVSTPHANTQPEIPRPTPTAIALVTAPPKVSRPAARPTSPHRTPSPPPTQTVPTPVTQPVTTPVTTPTVPPPPSATNNGRWSSPTVKTWKAAATKQSTRTQKGKPPWAGGQGNSQPTTTTTETAAVAAPDTSETPPGQAKTPPGQDKTPPGQDKKGQSPQG